MIRFSLDRWAAWAAELDTPESWLAWLQAPRRIGSNAMPSLPEMPAMMRRRVERLGRVALQAAFWGQGDHAPCPVVFASRFGDLSRSVDLLSQLASKEPMSPTSFSMSVHNAIAALFSIATRDDSISTSVAAGEETVAAAFVEAIGMLAEGAEAVLLVYYDEPPPPPYEQIPHSFNFARAWACRLVRAEQSGISLQLLEQNLPGQVDDLPVDLAVLRTLLSLKKEYVQQIGARCWQWQHHA